MKPNGLHAEIFSRHAAITPRSKITDASSVKVAQSEEVVSIKANSPLAQEVVRQVLV